MPVFQVVKDLSLLEQSCNTFSISHNANLKKYLRHVLLANEKGTHFSEGEKNLW
jgi:hypothetical protein